MPRRFPSFRLTPLVFPLLLLVGACGGQEGAEPGEVEIVDVAPSRTSILTTAYDDVATQRREAFSGVLPSDFPPDLPLYDPSNITDFGDGEGSRWVLMFSSDAATMVRDRMRDQLARSGWALIEGDGERGTWRRGSQSVILDIRDARPGTEIRVEY